MSLRIPLALVSLALCALAACPVPAGAQERIVVNGIELGYDGRYAADPSFHRLLLEIGSCRSEAIARANDFLGLQVPDDDRIVVRFDDTGDDREGFNFSSTATNQALGREEITVRPAFFVSGLIDLRVEMRHEAIHAVLRRHLGERHGPIPDLLREGLAIVGAGQLPDRLFESLAVAKFGTSREVAAQGGGPALADALDGTQGPYLLENHIADAYLVEWWIERGGPGTVGRWVARVAGGMGWREALEAELGMPLAEIRRLGGEHARAALAAIRDPGQEREYEAALFDLYGQRRFEEAAEVLQALLDGGVPDYLVPAMLYYQGRSYYRLRRYPEALERFRPLRSQWSHVFGMQESAQYYLAKSLLQTEHFDEAEAAFVAYERDFRYGPPERQLEAAYFHGEVLGRQGRLLDALPHYARASEGPNDYQEDAMIRRIAAVYHLGRREEAASLIRRFEEEFPDSSRMGMLDRYR